jgi:hypothetical protein
MLKSKPEITQLVRVLIDSTCEYAAPRIQNERNRFAYVRAMSRCFAICNSVGDKDSLSRMRLDLLTVLHERLSPEYRCFELISDTNKYYKMGVEHSLDIVKSISRRFDGYLSSTADTARPRSILEVFNRESIMV